MNKPIFELKNVTVLGNKNSSNVTKILNNLSLTTNDLNLLSSIVLAICMMIPRFDKLFKIKKTILRSVKSSE